MTDTRIPDGAWFKSSYSDGGNACVEVANLTSAVAMRDSKQSDGPALVLAPSTFDSFITGMREGGFTA